MNILLITDAWFPQVSGVVRTFSTTRDELVKMGHTVDIISPDQFPTIPCPTYPDIRLAFWIRPRISRTIQEKQPDAIHITTEGPLGFAARIYCARKNIPFTTSYATKFPEYIHARARIPTSLTYSVLRWFHKPSKGVMVATDTLKKELEEKKFSNLVRWTRGVDVELFHPRDKDFLSDKRPILMYVGRVAIEKNIKAFLDLQTPGTKYVVGGGPQLESLKKNSPHVQFTGPKHGEDLAKYYAAADVLVFPSLTDTFGLVMLEALASGVPVAAFPVPGPIDVIGGSDAGVLDEDLDAAVEKALHIAPEKCRDFALSYSWEKVASTFAHLLSPISWETGEE